jgi:uncharacterized protein (DUF983 family)
MAENEAPPSPIMAALSCRCPRCGKGRLFNGFLTLAPRCEHCGLDYSFADSGDGPAIFVIFAVSPIVVVLAMLVEALFHPAPLVHLALWIPTTIILCLLLLRPFKAWMIIMQYRHNAHEGRL